MADEKAVGAPALHTNIETGGFDEKRGQVPHHHAAPPKGPAHDDEEDEDMDALIEDLESEDGHQEEEEEVQPGGARIVPEDMLQTDSRVGLTESEVVARRRKYGLNQMKEEKENLILKFLGFFIGPIQFVMEVSFHQPSINSLHKAFVNPSALPPAPPCFESRMACCCLIALFFFFFLCALLEQIASPTPNPHKLFGVGVRVWMGGSPPTSSSLHDLQLMTVGTGAHPQSIALGCGEAGQIQSPFRSPVTARSVVSHRRKPSAAMRRRLRPLCFAAQIS